MTHKQHRRVRWRVRRCLDGWLPVILIGEEPLTLRAQPDKHLARDAARSYANQIRNASQSY
jgi:hypothetical protein